MKRSRRVIASLAAALIATTPAGADELRNMKIGEALPEFEMPTVERRTIRSADYDGKVLVLVFLSARQQSSERTAEAAETVLEKLGRDDVALAFVTPNVADTARFRGMRERLRIDAPIGLDFDRKLYGGLGLIVLPTTIITDVEGCLAHVISSYRAGYAHELDARIRHAVGLIDDAALALELAPQEFDRNAPADRVARHRATARLLREKGLAGGAEKELLAALAILPDDPGALLDLASLHLRGDVRINDAAAIVARVRTAHPDDRRALLLHGVVLFRQGRLDEAQAALEEALALNPDPLNAHYYLGLVHEARGEYQLAAQHFKQALARVLEQRPL